MTLHVGAEQGWGDWKNSQTLGCLLNNFRNFVEKEIRMMEMASGRNRAKTDNCNHCTYSLQICLLDTQSKGHNRLENKYD